MGNEPEKTENYGPEAMLKALEEMGRGDGPLAQALRSARGKKQVGSLAIGSTYQKGEGDK